MPDDSNEPFAFTCPHCKLPSLATIAGAVSLPRQKPRKMKELLPEMQSAPERVALIECQGCSRPCLYIQEDFAGTWCEREQLWPSPGRPVSEHVPAKIRDDFNEARTCLNAGAPTAAATMVRRALEAVCKDQGSTKSVLAQSLDELSQLGKIDGRLLDWAHQLRVLGNSAAHSTTNRISLQDASDALSFLEALLDYLYVLAAQFSAFQWRSKNPLATDPPF